MNGKRPKLSVVVPVHKLFGRMNNFSSWLNEAQRHKIQLIIVHDIGDGETQGSLEEVLSSYHLLDFILVQGYYGGPGNARNAGSALAHGRWIAFWDSDDNPNINQFMEMVDTADENGSEVAIGLFEKYSDLTNQKIPFDNRFCNRLENLHRYPGLWRFAINQDLVNLPRFPELMLGEDQLFILALKLEERRILFYNHSVYGYFTGLDFHLTSQSINYPDIKELIMRSLSLQREHSSLLILNFIFRQNLSLFKLGSYKLKIWVILNLLKLVPKLLMQRNLLKVLYSQIYEKR